MSERWQTDRLGKYCYIKARIGWRGLSASEYTESGPFLIAGKHIESGIIDWDACDHISEFRYRESSEIALAEGDVILTKDGTIGRVARVDSLPEKATINGTMMLVRPERGINYRYLYHVLNGAKFKKLIEDKVSGSSIPHIFQRDMVTLPISFPSIKHQVKLAQILDALDAAVHETETIIAKLKAVKQGLLHDLLTRGIDANGELRPPQAEAPRLYKPSPLGWIPKEWNAVELSSLLSSIGQGWSPDCESTPANSGHWGILKTTAITWTGYNDQENKALPPVLKARPDLEVKPDDILVTRAGPSSRVGVIAYVASTRERLLISDKMYRLRILPSEVTAYVALALSSQTVQSQIARTLSGMAESQTNISQAIVKGLMVFRPKFDEQVAIVDRIAACDTRLREEERCLVKLTASKAGLMADLLTGHVRVTSLLAEAERQERRA